jgi:virulence factor Mce-like protein
METRPPTPVQLLVAVAFAISCFGLLLFLWLAFGGPTPLKPESYRVTVPFDEATQLAVESDVRISGVSVGRVKSIELNDDGLADAELEINERYAPIPSNARAILRQKTLLGETYVELTPGSQDQSPLPKDPLPEGGALPPAQVSDAVELDEIFRTFDEPTRAAFQAWQQEVSVALRHRGADLSAAIGNLGPFASDLDRLLRILDTQRVATRDFVRDTGEVFTALSERRGQLSGLIRNSERVFSTTAARNESLQQAFIALPTFLDEQRLTLDRLERFSTNTNPLITQLRPAARELSPTLIDLERLAPELRDFFIGFRKAANRAKPGFPALREILDDVAAQRHPAGPGPTALPPGRDRVPRQRRRDEPGQAVRARVAGERRARALPAHLTAAGARLDRRVPGAPQRRPFEPLHEAQRVQHPGQRPRELQHGKLRRRGLGDLPSAGGHNRGPGVRRVGAIRRRLGEPRRVLRPAERFHLRRRDQLDRDPRAAVQGPAPVSVDRRRLVRIDGLSARTRARALRENFCGELAADRKAIQFPAPGRDLGPAGVL